jgi:hypothetical protein
MVEGSNNCAGCLSICKVVFEHAQMFSYNSTKCSLYIVPNICKYLLMIDQQYIFIYKLNHANWMKMEGDTIFSYGNNIKHSLNDGPITYLLISS